MNSSRRGEKVQLRACKNKKLADSYKRYWSTAFLFCLVFVVLWPAVPAGERDHSSLRASQSLLDRVDFLKRNHHFGTDIPIIVRVDRDYFRAQNRNRSDRTALRSIHGYSARFSARQVEALLRSPLVEYVTLDVPVRLSGSSEAPEILASATTLDEVRQIIGADDWDDSDGRGVTVALVDSGISNHRDLKRSQRVKVSVDFTSGEPVMVKAGEDADSFGHGTHVAGIIAAEGSKSQYETQGMASGVEFVDVRVVGEDGWGLTSNLIAAIDWLVENRDVYNIRVANLSLGHPPVEPYYQDPLCAAVRRMVEAGIVSVVSAGNLGKDDEGNPLWGGINSPGTEPTAITVSPINTHGTLTHSDDIATTYGSRGSAADNLFKPDLSAPGNRILSLQAEHSSIVSRYPELAVGEDYMILSGASMATGVVTGVVAMMLEENPELTPNLVKTILLVTAAKLEQPSMLEQGNGLVNAKVALDVAASLNVRKQELKKEIVPVWELEGEEIWAGGAFAFGDQVLYTPLWDEELGQLFWGDGVIWTDGVIWSDRQSWLNGVFRSDGVIWTDGVIWSDRQVSGQSSLAWTDGVFWTEGVIWTDGVIWSDRQSIPSWFMGD